MTQGDIDLKKEQEATLTRPRFPYSRAARFFFQSMDLLTGSQTTLAKAKLVETLAGVPYRAWENRQYGRMTRHYRDAGVVQEARGILSWARAARDNEHWHLLVIEEKMREDGIKPPFYLADPLPKLMVAGYALMSYVFARASIERAFLFNAEFEDHAEHTYAELVRDHPEWEDQPVRSELVRRYAPCDTWSDVFRRIGLDERDHMNESFRHAGRDRWVVPYGGMPEHGGADAQAPDGDTG